MSFFGKKFKRTKTEGLEELMDALKVEEKLRSFAKSGGGSVTTFVKNDDGTYSYSVEAAGKTITNSTFRLGEESDFPRPDGVVVRSRYQLDGDTLTQTLSDPEGRLTTFVREFSDNGMKMTVSSSGVDAKATIEYEVVQ